MSQGHWRSGQSALTGVRFGGIRAVAVAIALIMPVVVSLGARGSTLSAAMLPDGAQTAARAIGMEKAQATELMTQGQPFRGTPAVGTLFNLAADGALENHFCSASVVESPSGNVVMTAAHCVRDQVPGQFAFVPGYHGGQAPYGVWTVRRVLTDGRWNDQSSPDDDFAFLQVAKAGSTARLEDVTGAEQIGFGVQPRQLVTAVGYPNWRERPVHCLNYTVPFRAHQLRFACAGYTVGTSGGPLLANVDPVSGLGTIVGVIGGYHQGGYTDAVSYAARLGNRALALYRAASGGR